MKDVPREDGEKPQLDQLLAKVMLGSEWRDVALDAKIRGLRSLLQALSHEQIQERIHKEVKFERLRVQLLLSAMQLRESPKDRQ